MFLWPQKPSWTGRLKPHGLYSLSAPGSQTPALRGSTLPMARMCSSCLLAPITIPWTSLLHSRPPTQAAPRTGKSEQHLPQGRRGTWHQGHRMGHSPALHKALGGQTAGGHYRVSSGLSDIFPRGTRLEAAVGYPNCPLPHSCFQPRAERLPAPAVPAVAHPSLPHAAVLSPLQ